MENKDEPRVLIGCVTHDKDEIYITEFIKAIRSQSYSNYDLLFVDTSGDDEYAARLRGTGGIVSKDESMLGGRNKIREHAIKKNYDYLWFVDINTLPPPTALSRLILKRKDIIAGISLQGMNIDGNLKVMPNVYEFDKKEKCFRPVVLNEVLNDHINEISCANFGCVLISRKVLENIEIRYYEDSMAGEDIAFFVDAKEKGFRTFADNSVKCTHLVFPPGDPRNSKFMFESYEKRV